MKTRSLRHRAHSRARRGGFLLLEIMVAVGIFSLGVLALGKAMMDCVSAQKLRADSERARLALENRMLEIQANPAMPDDYKKRKLTGAFEGLSIIERRTALQLKNEDGAVLGGLNQIDLTVEWSDGGDRLLTRTISFYLTRGS